ncbi:MAG TPA: dephospho-CoA kinase, partial [Planctomycetes bacterium]|nr:dephospho-CoA kinase [Planctomycetota bacterium]
KALVLGLLGGVASGKSAVARLFQEAGAHVLDADKMAQSVLDQPEVAAQVEEKLGPGLLDPQGRIDRKALAQKVFRSEKARRSLEALVHPKVLAWIEEGLSRLRKAPNLVVLDVPLLLETGLDGECDILVFVETPEGAREKRALLRGWPPGERRRREKTQLPLETKRAKADYILNNSGSLDETRKQVLDLIGRWEWGGPGP